MGTVLSKMEMLNKALKVLPATEEDIVLTGIISKIAERIAEFKKAEKKILRNMNPLKN
jgi:hypothetical protein